MIGEPGDLPSRRSSGAGTSPAGQESFFRSDDSEAGFGVGGPFAQAAGGPTVCRSARGPGPLSRHDFGKTGM